ncbi:D-alanyl-D-alanine carboxypeptidase [Kitasatospora arboriphila]
MSGVSTAPDRTSRTGGLNGDQAPRTTNRTNRTRRRHAGPGRADDRRGGPPGGGSGGDTQDILGRILDKPIYAHAQWGVLEEDPQGGVLHELQSDKFFIPGSVAKLFTVSGTWHALGGDHRFTTPVHAVGTRDGAGLHGDLVLVAQGDLALGGRVTPEGTLDFTSIDHTYANDLPGATLTPEDPLAGIDDIARQIRQSGISRVDGDVVVDTRLFETPPSIRPPPR